MKEFNRKSWFGEGRKKLNIECAYKLIPVLKGRRMERRTLMFLKYNWYSFKSLIMLRWILHWSDFYLKREFRRKDSLRKAPCAVGWVQFSVKTNNLFILVTFFSLIGARKSQSVDPSSKISPSNDCENIFFDFVLIVAQFLWNIVAISRQILLLGVAFNRIVVGSDWRRNVTHWELLTDRAEIALLSKTMYEESRTMENIWAKLPNDARFN